MPKYTEPFADITERRWLKRVANEGAETNRLIRKFLKQNKGMALREPDTQDDEAGN